jgi:predicted house-cleaning noncanonical NTP pyrophosphatase (MazG superfamily)
MRKFKFQKLVRDLIVDQMKDGGASPTYHELSDKEHLAELKNKILEEASEMNINDKDELLKELADLQEVIMALVKAIAKSPADLKLAQDKKYQKAGGFDRKLYVDQVSVLDDDPWIKHFLNNPDRYPEIIDHDA